MSGSVGVVGTGFIGCSLALALREAGRTVLGFDRDRIRLELALELGHLDGPATSIADLAAAVEAVFVAVPVSGIAEAVCAALDAGAPAVSDVGSVKRPVVSAVEAARPEAVRRFVGGHPMAGSERDGPEGARKDLFAGATWVLTPVAST
ncbi:MAG: prephenate dehydrogenase/arogenate dehydrogenase family protein, partial [Acidimicrobiia bacterium]